MSRDVVEFAHDEVRNSILHGTLSPGTAVSQVQLAKELGVSRTPLREALRMLQREGLVEAQPNRLVRIRELSVQDAEGLYIARITLEAVAIRISTPLLTSQDIAAAQGRLAEMDHYVGAGEYEDWERTHREFHLGLIAKSGERISEMLEQLSAHAERYRRVVATRAPRAWSTGQKEHRAIVAACAERDGPAAATALAEHLARTAFTVIALIDDGYEPAALRTALTDVTHFPPTQPTSAQNGETASS
jgi:DNA-binding GntR family transcriptional regulator